MRFLTGPEIWLTISIFCLGAACGIGLFGFFEWDAERHRRDEDKK